MSYSLGQAKWVPGQISFTTLPQGRTGLPSVQPLLEAGLPIAPYIEHGSFTTGEPAIMRYGLDPYRGIMGLGQGGGAAEPAKMNFELVIEGEPRGEYLFEELSEAADALAMAFSRSGKVGKVVSPPGSENVVADVAAGRGTVRMLHGLGQTLGRSIRRIEAQDYAVHCDRWSQRPGQPGRVVRGMRAAMREAESVLSAPNNRTDICRIYPMPVRGWMSPGKEVASVRLRPSGKLDVRFNFGLGDAQTAPGMSRTTSVLIGAAAGAGIAAAVKRNVALGALGGAAVAALLSRT